MNEENQNEEVEKTEENTNRGNSDEIIELKKEIERHKNELNEQSDRYKRIMAEFDNFKKRSSKERDTLYQSLVSDIYTSLLPVIDNLEKAVGTKTEDEGYKQGIELVLKQFQDVLHANGVEAIEAVGQPFDPELHEAVASVVDENLGEKIIKEEYRKGYKIGNRVIRHFYFYAERQVKIERQKPFRKSNFKEDFRNGKNYRN